MAEEEMAEEAQPEIPNPREEDVVVTEALDKDSREYHVKYGK